MRGRGRLVWSAVVAVLALAVPAGASTPAPEVLGDRLAAALEAGGTHTVAVSLDAALADVAMAGLQGLGLEVQPMASFPVAVVRGSSPALAAIAGLPGVRSAWLDAPLSFALAESRALVGADAVHTELGVTGAGVGIAVLDSGIEATHPDLTFGTKTVQNVKVAGFQGTGYDGPLTALAAPVEDVPDTDLTTGHGTHVAGIAAGDGSASGGRLRGVAHGAHLVGIGAGDAYLVTTLAGYDWLLANHDTYGVRVLNNSWADGSIAYDPSHPLNVASQAAVDAGIVVVQAAGNDGQASGDVYNRFAPPWVIGVGGVDKLGRLGAYSSRGTDERHADLVAPGSFIASTMARTGATGIPNQTPFDLTDPAAPRMLRTEELPYYTVKVGTSMAAPHVAGVAALVLEANPALTPAQVKQVLVATARPVTGCATVDCGAGLVDARAAVALAQDLAAPAPVAPVAALVATPSTGAAPLTTTLDAGASADADGTVVSYAWDLDGDHVPDTTTTTATIQHTVASGVHRVAVVVTDDDGLRSAPATVELRASDPPVASASGPKHARTGRTATLDASTSHDPDGAVVSYRFDLGDGTVVEQAGPVLEHVWVVDRPTRFAWTVTVTDDAGLQDAVVGTTKVTPGNGG